MSGALVNRTACKPGGGMAAGPGERLVGIPGACAGQVDGSGLRATKATPMNVVKRVPRACWGACAALALIHGAVWANAARTASCAPTHLAESHVVSSMPSMVETSRSVSLPLVGMDVYVLYRGEDELTVMHPSTSDRPALEGLLVHWYMAGAQVQSTHLLCVYGQDRLTVVHRVFEGAYKQCLVKRNQAPNGKTQLINAYCE